MVFKMKRNEIIDIFCHNKLKLHKQRIAFHEAGHAAAIYLNNKARNLPPVYFQITFKELTAATNHAAEISQTTYDDSIARVEGGRLIHSLPYAINDLAHKLLDQKDAMAPLVREYLSAFEADIINLLIGPLSEAKHVYNRDDEPFNHKLVDLKALKNYGGRSDLKLAREYLKSFSVSKQLQDEKLHELFAVAFDFVSDYSNWKAITKLADYIFESNKNIISFEEVVYELES